MCPAVHIDFKKHSLSVMRSAKDICSFDHAGRLISYFDGEAHYWRGLSGTMVRKQTDPTGRKQVRVLDRDSSLNILGRAQDLLRIIPECSVEVRSVVSRALGYDPDADQAAFRRVYGKVGILPPDQYLALVLQVSTGCAWNRCTFCQFYRDQGFHRRSVAEFRDHVGTVLDFLGDSLLLRKSIFLGDADVCAVPAALLTEMIRIACDQVGLGDVHAFAEAASIVRTPPGELKDLAALGLRRLYIGAESGSDSLLEAFQKRSRTVDVAAAVEAMKGAGLQVSLIFLAGAGHAGHVPSTVSLAQRLPLGPGDLVYLSRLWGAPEITADEELRQIQQGLAFLKERGVKVSPYDIRQFAY